MGRKLCSITGLNARGLPCVVHVEAESLFEAAAAGLEALKKNGCLITELQVTVHEPKQQYKVHPNQLGPWLRSYGNSDSVGIRALKSRVRNILRDNPLK